MMKTSDLLSEMRLQSHMRVADELEHETDLPGEIVESLRNLGLSAITEARKIKQSFHETFMIELEDPASGVAIGSRGDPTRAVAQVIGVEVGDKGLFSLDAPVSVAGIIRAHELARWAGVRVPNIWASGTLPRRGPFLDLPFVVYECINTDTVEDRIRAPAGDWRRIVDRDVMALLAAHPLDDVDTASLPRIPDVYSLLAEFLKMARETADDPLCEAICKLDTECREKYAIIPGPLVLIHQDLNGGNVLCSRNCGHQESFNQSVSTAPVGDWCLDAVIDWESAVVGDIRLVSDQEPWCLVKAFGRVVLARWLCHKARTSPEDMPRCNLAELAENHDNSERLLARSGWLDIEAE